MSARIASRRLREPALIVLKPARKHWICAPITRRSISTTPKCGAPNPPEPKPTSPSSPAQDASNPLANPVIEAYLKKQKAAEVADAPQVTIPQVDLGSLAPSSIFDPNLEIPGIASAETPEQRELLRLKWARHQENLARKRERQLFSMRLDPKPEKRKRFERRMVIRGVTRNGRVTRDVELARTERSYQYKSQNLPTSVKKLTKLMNQIAGKTVEEALVQLRFSKKKVALEVWKGLQVARDEAIVKRGMGLGAAPLGVAVEKVDEESIDERIREAPDEEEGQTLNPAEAQQAIETLFPNGTRLRSPPESSTPIPIQLKTGKTKNVYDPTELYVDQAWVGKGYEAQSVEFRARGRVNTLKHRSTKFSVILKEEATRIRLSQEILKKKDNRKTWVALPDRPVQQQRQYCLW